MQETQWMKTRRSIRKYKKDPIPKEILTDILDCARVAPSGHNAQGWKIVCVTNQEMRDKMAEACKYGKFFTDVPAVMAVFIGPEGLCRVEDASCATSTMIYAAHAHGLGSCWVWANKCPHTELIHDLLGAPKEWELLELLALGYPDEAPTRRKKALEEISSWERF